MNAFSSPNSCDLPFGATIAIGFSFGCSSSSFSMQSVFGMRMRSAGYSSCLFGNGQMNDDDTMVDDVPS